MERQNEVFLDTFDMKVAAKIIQLVASGIYRTPANALKELISNAFDACASRVDITIEDNENNPRIIMYDNGEGINSGDFIFSMTHIGASLKKIGSTSECERPVIGRIGIGLLSVGQATNYFEIESVSKNGVGMRAEIDLSPYFDAIKMVESLDELKIGNVTVYEFDAEPNQSYTKVVLKDIKEPFLRALVSRQWYGKHFNFIKNPSYETFVDWVDESKIKRLDEISPYNRFMYELGLLTPVRYLEDGPIRGNTTSLLLDIKKRLEDYNFRVYVDGIEIFKPILFPHKSDLPLDGDEPYKVYVKEIDTVVNNRIIKAVCYYYHQSVRIIPYELRGLLLRVKNVGIGTYDNNFSKIASESPIVLHQLTGELYIDEGLDESLNIDRNSFFETDSAYQKLWLEILSWVNPNQLPDISEEYDIVPVDYPVSRDIRVRMEKIRKEKREIKINREMEELKCTLTNMFTLNNYEINGQLDIQTTINSSYPLSIELTKENNQTILKVNLNRSYNISVQNIIIHFLTAQKIALDTSKGNQELFNELFTSLLLL